MGTLASIVTRARRKISDTASARWSDADMVAFAQEAVERMEMTLAKFDIQFAKERATIETVASQDYISLPEDFLSDKGLFRAATNTALTKKNEDGWERIISAGELTNYIILGDRIYLKGTPSTAENLILHYYTTNDTSAWSDTTMAADTTPWGGKCDSILVWYMTLVAANIDGMDWSADQALMNDLERRVFETYGTLGTLSDESEGWL